MTETNHVGWIDTPGGPLFAWFHPPAAATPRRSRAVVICDAYGPDRMNLHLSHRTLALFLAERGYATIRFDPLGTGDSSGSPRDPGFIANWLSDFAAASDFVRAHAGVSEIVAIGTRFGGTLAAWAAASRFEVTSVALWGPYLKGRDFLRADRALSRVSGANGSGRPADHGSPDDEAYLGFVYSAEARQAIEALDLAELDPASCHRARIVGWDQDSNEDRLAAAWLSAGADVEFVRPDGLRSDDSIEQQAVPEAMLRETVAWIEAGEPSGDAAMLGEALARGAELPTLRACAQVERGRGSVSASESVEERVVFFGEDRGLVGIVTLPREGVVAGKSALILVNGGNNHRPGINRNHTEWARNAAQAGHACLRFDIRGLGDSPPRRAEDRNVLYRDETQEDVRAAIDCMSTLVGDNGIYLAGLCAGAYQAFHTARVDPRVRGIVLLDLLRWDSDSASGPRTGFWNRRRRTIERFVQPIRRRVLGGERSSLAAGLLDLTRRGTEVLVVSCVEGKGYELVRDALGEDLSALEASEHFLFRAVEDTNHIFTPLWAQAWLWEEMGAFLERGSKS